MDTPRPSPRTNRTRRVPHPVLIGRDYEGLRRRGRASRRTPASSGGCGSPPRGWSGAGPTRRHPPPSPSRTKWTRLVHPSVLTGHVSLVFRRAPRRFRRVGARSSLEGRSLPLSKTRSANKAPQKPLFVMTEGRELRPICAHNGGAETCTRLAPRGRGLTRARETRRVRLVRGEGRGVSS